MRPTVPRAPIFALLVVIIGATAFIGCTSDELTGTHVADKPPEVWLGIGPREGSTVSYNVHFFWGGFDPDGKISHFEYAIANNDTGMFDPADTTGVDKWFPTAAKDSVFLFSADEIGDSNAIDFDTMKPYEFLRTHTFFIRAVDEQGLRSEPAYRSFTARNLSPVINIEIPRTIGESIAIVPPIITFTWSARDFIGTRDEAQDPASTRSILVPTSKFTGNIEATLDYIRTTPDAEEWTKWFAYNAPGDSGRFWRPEEPLGFGSRVFAVQARDEAGAISPVLDRSRNVRVIFVDQQTTGPALIVTSPLLGEVKTATTETPLATINVPAGIPISFSWTADASGYGGVVTAFRYGWDMLDLNDPQQWEVNFSPFIGSSVQSAPRTFFFGTHTFHVEVKDNSDARSRVGIVLNVIQFTQERPLLLIDDWPEQPVFDSWQRTAGATPSDSEHDGFWADVLSNVAGFSPTADQLPSMGSTRPLGSVPITTLAKYRTLIWNARGTPLTNSNAALEDHIRIDAQQANLVRLFMEAGGHVLICGDHALTMVVNKAIFRPEGPFQSGFGPRYPFIYRYELGGVQTSWSGPGAGPGEKSFAYDACCVNVIDLTQGILFSKPRRNHCPVDAVRSFDGRAEGLRAATPSDRDYDFPRLELRPETAGPGKWHAPDALGYAANIFNPPYFASCEASQLIPPRSCFEPMYELECKDPSAVVFGAPVGFWTTKFLAVPDAYGVTARSAVWGFSPVYFNPAQVEEALGIILFDEWQLDRIDARRSPQAEVR